MKRRPGRWLCSSWLHSFSRCAADWLYRGEFADLLGEDYLGLRELGIAAEFGMSNLSIPKRLLKGKKGQNKPTASVRFLLLWYDHRLTRCAGLIVPSRRNRRHHTLHHHLLFLLPRAKWTIRSVCSSRIIKAGLRSSLHHKPLQLHLHYLVRPYRIMVVCRLYRVLRLYRHHRHRHYYLLLLLPLLLNYRPPPAASRILPRQRFYPTHPHHPTLSCPTMCLPVLRSRSDR